jgi:hypothetical protein
MENSSYYRFKNSTSLGIGPAGYEVEPIDPEPKMYTIAYKTKDPQEKEDFGLGPALYNPDKNIILRELPNAVFPTSPRNREEKKRLEE